MTIAIWITLVILTVFFIIVLSKDFIKHQNIEGVIHFAASKAVGESVQIPLQYYHNNISTLIYLLEEMAANSVNNFIFSSSCTVYGQADSMPITENAPFKTAESPYGNTKQIGEEIIADTTKASDLNACYNPAFCFCNGLG